MSITGAAAQVNRSQPWGSKWWKRFKSETFDGLEDRPRSGRPPLVAKELMGEIRKEMSKTESWTSDLLLDLIHEKTSIRYCLGYGGVLFRKWGYTMKAAVKQHANRAGRTLSSFRGTYVSGSSAACRREYPSLYRTSPY